MGKEISYLRLLQYVIIIYTWNWNSSTKPNWNSGYWLIKYYTIHYNTKTLLFCFTKSKCIKRFSSMVHNDNGRDLDIYSSLYYIYATLYNCRKLNLCLWYPHTNIQKSVFTMPKIVNLSIRFYSKCCVSKFPEIMFSLVSYRIAVILLYTSHLSESV